MAPDGHAETLMAEIASDSARLRPLAERVPELERTLADLEQRIGRIEGSISWRLTTPLRASGALVRGRRVLARKVGRQLRAFLDR